jgi:hypothetical protein
MITKISIRGTQVSKGERLPEMLISTFSTNWRVNLKFCIHVALRGLDCPMQKIMTSELTSKSDLGCRLPAHVQ